MAVVEVGVGSKQAVHRSPDATGFIICSSHSVPPRLLLLQQALTSQKNSTDIDYFSFEKCFLCMAESLFFEVLCADLTSRYKTARCLSMSLKLGGSLV
jgi:hypothetical protein